MSSKQTDNEDSEEKQRNRNEKGKQNVKKQRTELESAAIGKRIRLTVDRGRV